MTQHVGNCPALRDDACENSKRKAFDRGTRIAGMYRRCSIVVRTSGLALKLRASARNLAGG